MGNQPYPYYGTQVSVAKSMDDIRRLIYKYGGEHIQWTEGLKEQLLQLSFSIRTSVEGKKMLLPVRVQASLKSKREQSVYRAMFYFLKSKFEMVTFGIASMEEEFLPYILLQLPGGPTTVAEQALPHIRKGLPPSIKPLLPALPPAED